MMVLSFNAIQLLFCSVYNKEFASQLVWVICTSFDFQVLVPNICTYDR
jgi:hypothetical protein